MYRHRKADRCVNNVLLTPHGAVWVLHTRTAVFPALLVRNVFYYYAFTHTLLISTGILARHLLEKAFRSLTGFHVATVLNFIEYFNEI